MPADHLAINKDVGDELPDDIQTTIEVAMEKMAFRETLSHSVEMGATARATQANGMGGPTFIAALILGLDVSPMGIILVMMLNFLFLGTLLDWIGIEFLRHDRTLPIRAAIITVWPY